MQFGQIYNGDDENNEEIDLQLPETFTGEERVEIFRAVKEAIDRLNSMPPVDPRPSPSVPTPHPLDKQDEREVNE